MIGCGVLAIYTLVQGGGNSEWVHFCHLGGVISWGVAGEVFEVRGGGRGEGFDMEVKGEDDEEGEDNEEEV
ncbi:hypothetical protein TL16_g05504 [Triparma laevis f. inornata]|uniref:Uncharacterized protein n=2 Tax=Triparma laevis TaxID=1534972 RepID=A0A9W7FT95_9STRA|nr:hypothetical protein TL16_g05504 [Triparma laevis f. inornata]GMI18682.1 hypothetical protein TrLO_g2162 [Triparma laevis f. longispina]